MFSDDLNKSPLQKKSQASPLFITLTQKPNQMLTVMKKEIYVYHCDQSLFFKVNAH